MNEILTIKNFCPIIDMPLGLRVVNIFIGDQGTGKSTVAKVLSVVKEMFDLVNKDENKQTFRCKERVFGEQLEIKLNMISAEKEIISVDYSLQLIVPIFLHH